MDESLIKSAVDLIVKHSLFRKNCWETTSGHEHFNTIYQWPGSDAEDILVDAYRKTQDETMWDSPHRHDFYYFIYILQGSYTLRIAGHAKDIVLRQGDILLGQPHSELHSLSAEAGTIIINILLRKEVFIHNFLQMISTDEKLFSFFMEPIKNPEAANCIHFHVMDNGTTTALIQLITVEYAFRQQDSQEMLKPLSLAFIKQISRLYTLEESPKNSTANRSEELYQYMYNHMDTITLKRLANHFGLHPCYVSTMLHRELGTGYTRLLLDMRMQRARMLMENTSLSIEAIANLLGYYSTSSFYSAFKKYYGDTPRNYLKQKS